MGDPEYDECIRITTSRYQLRRIDNNTCAKVLYHELSKHTHGNTGELFVRDSEHTMPEIAAIESVFCTLKKRGCFHIPLTIIVK